MKKSVKIYLYTLILSPLISFLLHSLFAIEPMHFYRVYTMIVLFDVLYTTRVKIIFPKYLYYLAVYILYLLIWDLYNYAYNDIILFEVIRKPYIEIISFIVIVENIVIERKFIEKCTKLFKYTILLSFVFVVIQIAINPTFFIHETLIELSGSIDKYQIRRSSIFGFVSLNSYGLDFLPILALLCSALLIKKKKVLWVYLILGGIISFGTNTRYIMVGYLLILTMIFVQSKLDPNKTFKYVLIVSFVGFLGIQLFEYLGYDIWAFYNDRLFKEATMGNSTRYLALLAFLKFFPQSPWFGTGIHLTNDIKIFLGGVSSQIHVGYLSHLVSYGIIGSIPLFIFWYKIIKRFFHNARLTKRYGSFYAFLIFLWANMTMVQYPIFGYGIIMAFVFDKFYLDRNNYGEISSGHKD